MKMMKRVESDDIEMRLYDVAVNPNLVAFATEKMLYLKGKRISRVSLSMINGERFMVDYETVGEFLDACYGHGDG